MCFITGTCKKCTLRFSLPAKDVIIADTIYCPNCGCEFDFEGQNKIRMMAQALLYGRFE